MSNRLREKIFHGFLILSFLSLSISMNYAQNCGSNSNPYFVFHYNGPDTIETSPACEAALNWPLNTPIISCVGPPATCTVIQFSMSPALTGYSRGEMVRAGQTVDVKYVFEGTTMVNGILVNVKDTFCFPIAFVDTISPLFTTPPPANLTVDCFYDLSNSSSLTMVDDCDASYPKVVDPVETGSATLCGGGTITRTWMSTDSSGNTASAQQIITVNPDNVFPVVAGSLPNDTVACEMEDYPNWIAAQRLYVNNNASDNCGIKSITDDGPLAFPDTCGSLVVTFSVIDSCDNITTAIASYTLIDTIPPVLSGLDPSMDTLTISCTENIPVLPMIVGTDNCQSPVDISFEEQSTQTNDDSCTDYTYSITRTWIGDDNCGNEDTLVQIIYVQDTEAPTFSEASDTTVNCEEGIDTLVTGAPRNLSDNCDGNFTLTYMDMSSVQLSCPGNERIVRRWTARDVCGNESIDFQEILVQDTTPPSFIIPGDTIISCSDISQMNITGVPHSISDNCDADPEVSMSDVTTTTACIYEYTITRTWTVTDTCGNSTSSNQIIEIIDTIAPSISTLPGDVTIDCNSGMDADMAFADWISNRGNAIASDNCTPEMDLVWLFRNHGTNDVASLPALNCPSGIAGVVLSQEVDFIVFDACGKSDTVSATFTFIDNEAPQIIACPEDQIVNTDPGACSSKQLLALPRVLDSCNLTVQTLPIFSSKLISSSGVFGDVNIPVDPMEFVFIAPAAPVVISGNIELKIDLNNVDGESNTEFFNVKTTDGTVIGQTTRTDVQCGNSTTLITISDPMVRNDWINTGLFKVVLEPNIQSGLPGRFAINNICPNATVDIRLTYTTSTSSNISYEYSVNSGSRNPLGSFTIEDFGVGINNVKYYATDCAQNVDSCSFDITVNDNEAPEIICPADIAVTVDLDNCSADVTLPFPTSVSDNCPMAGSFFQQMPQNSNDELLSFYLDPDLNDYLANDKQFTFTGIMANAFGGDATLTVFLKADVDELQEFFYVIGEGGFALGTTEINQTHVIAGDCNTVGTATFNIPAALFNSWASDGNIDVQFISHTSIPVPPGGVGSGINPCNPAAVTMNGQTDGESRIWATLEYSTIEPAYYTSGATSISRDTLRPNSPAIHTFNEGITNVFYIIEDAHNNIDTCAFEIEVIDNIPPVAQCQPSILRINPAGSTIDTISVDDINNGSYDNCGIDTMYVVPNIFTCDLIDVVVDVDLIVVDNYGNRDTCGTFIRVEGVEPEPSYDYECGVDTLYLFANPPTAPGNIVFSFRWFGPNGLISTDENPIITNLNSFSPGNYCVEIEGITGCTTIGCLNIPIDLRPPQPTIDVPQQVCWNTDDIVLRTTPPQGVTGLIEYEWYLGTAPTGTLIGSTVTPSFTIPAPHNIALDVVDSRCYFVIVSIDGCASQPSSSNCVDIVRPPNAEVNAPVINVCEGSLLQLSTSVTGSDITYLWSGPTSFLPNDVQNPVVAMEVDSMLHAGNYNLVVSKLGCPSDPAYTIVNVLSRPEGQPSIFPLNRTICEGDQHTFLTNLIGVTEYHWVDPTGMERITTTNTLTFTATSNDNGNWYVYGVTNPTDACTTESSPIANLDVNTFPEQFVAAANPNPVCEGQNVQLEVSPTLSGAGYVWKNPAGQIISAQQNPILADIQLAEAGTYMVEITNTAGCSKTTSVDVAVGESVGIIGVSNDGPNCFTSPTNVNLNVLVFPPDDGSYDYHWTGPCNFESFDSSAVVPNVTADCGGVYSVVVTNGDNCATNPATTVVDGQGPFMVPMIAKSPDVVSFCEGEAVVLTTTPYSGLNIIYYWQTPNGTITTQVPSLTIDSLTVLAHNGPVKVSVNIDGCDTPISGEIDLKVKPIPIAIPSTNIPCQNDVLRLTGNVSPAGGNVTYSWDTPVGNFSVANPVIPNVDPTVHDGAYTLRVTRDGCESEPATVLVEITPGLATPITLDAEDICIGASDSLLLCVNPNNATVGGTYIWTNNLGDTIGITTALCLTVRDFAPYSTGSGGYPFFVSVTKNGCTTLNPAPVVVNFTNIPFNNANAGQDVGICENDVVALAAMPPSVGFGCWNLLENIPSAVITNQCQSSTSVNGLPSGDTYSFEWSLSYEACVDYSKDTVEISIYEVETADAGPDRLDTCDVNTLNLNAVPSLSGLGYWTQSAGQKQLGVVIDDINDPATSVSFPSPGEYVFTWVIPDAVCGGDTDFIIVNLSKGNPYAGDDFEDCGDGCSEIRALQNQSGVWSSPNSAINFIDPDENETVVCNLEAGINTLVWTIDGGACGDDSRDTVLLDYTLAPLAINDTFDVNYGGFVLADLVANDENAINYSIDILTPPSQGQFTTIGSGSYEYIASLNFVGEDIAVYEICSTDTDCNCSQASVYFKVGMNVEDCDPPSIITPNGDNKNESFAIGCIADITKHPNNEMVIFNRWGDEVFRQSPYLNEWRGTYNGQDLPDGTYFYILDLNSGDKPISGYLIIQR